MRRLVNLRDRGGLLGLLDDLELQVGFKRILFVFTNELFLRLGAFAARAARALRYWLHREPNNVSVGDIITEGSQINLARRYNSISASINLS